MLHAEILKIAEDLQAKEEKNILNKASTIATFTFIGFLLFYLGFCLHQSHFIDQPSMKVLLNVSVTTSEDKNLLLKIPLPNKHVLCDRFVPFCYETPILDDIKHEENTKNIKVSLGDVTGQKKIDVGQEMILISSKNNGIRICFAAGTGSKLPVGWSETLKTKQYFDCYSLISNPEIENLLSKIKSQEEIIKKIESKRKSNVYP
jgi:hypothetical protein